MAIVAAIGGLIAVFRATQPRTVGLRAYESDPHFSIPAPTFARMLELYTGSQVVSGNQVEPLFNGLETYPRLWDDLRSARRSITLQSYYSQPGALADRLSLILRRKARSGVRVLVLLDAFGSVALPERWLDDLRRAGVRVSLLRPLRWYNLHGSSDRSHVRAVVVDGRVAYTGGFGFADYWQGTGDRQENWRETNVRVEGPAALQLQAAFGAAWLEATGELLTGDSFFDEGSSKESSGIDAAVLFTATTTGSTPAERFLALAILSARERLYITNSYFVPNSDFRNLLADAVKRGVDVRVVTAGVNTDVKTTRYAARWQYEDLLRHGIRIYEYDAAMMHAKTIVVDGGWTAIGSMNFDNRSLAFNDESVLVAFDSSTASRMESAFRDDLRHSREITLAHFRTRGLRERLLEFGANLLSAIL